MKYAPFSLPVFFLLVLAMLVDGLWAGSNKFAFHACHQHVPDGQH